MELARLGWQSSSALVAARRRSLMVQQINREVWPGPVTAGRIKSSEHSSSILKHEF
jgi:hypothetical protein